DCHQEQCLRQCACLQRRRGDNKRTEISATA
ncbi:MAG: hypothetical protein AVDCRST_MAG75-2996, partial [uncultured Propionibacteriaceae bacterium]